MTFTFLQKNAYLAGVAELLATNDDRLGQLHPEWVHIDNDLLRLEFQFPDENIKFQFGLSEHAYVGPCWSGEGFDLTTGEERGYVWMTDILANDRDPQVIADGIRRALCQMLAPY